MMNKIVYQLKHHEYSKYKAHLMALDSESRYLRFAFPIGDDQLEKYCDTSFMANPEEHIIFVIEDDDLNVIAAGHIAVPGKDTELALSVLKEHQGKGCGSALLKTCIEWCQNRGIEKGFMICLANNKAVRHLATKYGIVETSAGESTADLRIPKPTPMSITNELVTSRFAQFEHIGKIQRKFLTKMFEIPLIFMSADYGQ